MNIIGRVIKITIDTPVEKQAGGSYPGWKLVYEEANGDVKTVAKHMNSLKYNAALKNGLEDLSPADDFTLEMVKDGDFWNPKSIYKGVIVQEVAATPTPATKTTNAKTTATGGSNTFEVNNELKAKQQKLDEVRQPLIVRQTCLTAATNLAVVLKLKTEADVLAQAERFIAFIETGDTTSIANEEIIDLEDDIV